MQARWCVSVGAIFMCAACSSGSGLTATGFITPPEALNFGQRVTVPVRLENEVNSSVSNRGIGTVAYVTGFNPDERRVEGYAGVAPGFRVGTAPRGTANFSARYQYLVYTNIQDTGTAITGIRGGEVGTIRLRADFDNGSVSGSTGDLTVDARIVGGAGTASGGRAMTGRITATYAGRTPTTSVSGSVEGEITGHIGSRGVIGAFRGQDDDTVIAGGLVGPRN